MVSQVLVQGGEPWELFQQDSVIMSALLYYFQKDTNA